MSVFSKSGKSEQCRLLAVSSVDVVDEFESESDARSSTATTKSMKTIRTLSSTQVHDDDEERQERSAGKTASVRFLEENLESVHHFEVTEHESSVEAVLSRWVPDLDEKTAAAEELRERTLLQLRDLRSAEMTPPNYDPSWD